MASSSAPPENQTLVGKLVQEIKDIKDRNFKEDAPEEEHPFAHLDKSTVLQDCKVFHDATYVRMHPKRCCAQLTRLLFLLTAEPSTRMAGAEAESVFFGVTKLFQSTDGNLRRLVYLFLRTVADSTDASSLIIVTQSLVKDMFNEVSLYKGNALRVLAAIVDASMLGQLERYFKQMIVDKDDYVASTALTASLMLMDRPGAADVIGRWVNEVQTVLTTRSDMVQFHALALLRTIKRHDRLAVSKVVQQLMKSNMRSPLGVCLLIRYTQTLLAADPTPAAQTAMLDFLESCMRHKSEMVVFEAARAVVALPGISARDVGPALTMLHMFLASPKPALRYAAVRTLHALAAAHPVVVAKCNEDLETLVSDSNRSIATLAITTLLKTGSEASIDRLMKTISGFMADVGSDELKVVVVQAIHELALRLPSKHRSIMSFLANALREEGGFDFKKAILDGLLDIMEVIPDAKHDGLLHLCEFIEDCEFASLASRVLHLLGDQGPSATQPSLFIRFIYNRVILENAQVRASAVTALAKFAVRVEDLRPSIIPLLTRCLDDDDDEVRDRATMYLSMLGGLPASSGSTDASAPSVADARLSKSLTAGRLPHSVTALQKSLQLYQLRPAAGPFSFDALPHVDAGAPAAADSDGGFGYTSEIRAAEAAAVATKIARARARLTTSALDAANAAASGATSAGSAGVAGSAAASAAAASAADSAAEALYKIPQFASLGALFRTSKPKELTESELEYLVSVVKHMFANHIVFQFTIRNTVADVLLERATVVMTPSDASTWKHVVSIAAPRVREGAPATAYVCFQRDPEAGFGSASFECELRFNSREFDAAAGEPVGDPTPEEYPVEGVDVSPADFVAPLAVSEFRSAWEGLGADSEVLEQFALPIKSVAEAVAKVIDLLGMAPCEGTGSVKPGVPKHNAYLGGVFLGGVKALARMQVSLEGDSGCVLKLGIRAEDPVVSQLLMECVA